MMNIQGIYARIYRNIRGISINNRQDLNDNIKDILDYDGPILVDIRVVSDENCYPMVAPGKSNAQMMGV